jgi:hydroxymethylbilane synthase
VTAVLLIGTRGCRLALALAVWVRQRLAAAHPGVRGELVVIKTSGDRVRDVPLHQVGGKGLFVKELESALDAGEIECAVHSLKDVPGELADGLVIAAVPEREDPADVVVTRQPGGLGVLPHGARVGTSSPRRAALLRALWPALAVGDLRGNVDTRLAKLERGEVDAVVLAAAGLHRLGVTPAHVERCDVREFVPAIGQGALALESRPGAVATQLAALEHAPSRQAVDAERAFLQAVGGSCVTPLAAHATIAGGHLALRALIAHPDGSRIVRGEESGAVTDAARLGRALAERLLRDGGAELLRELVPSPAGGEGQGRG